MSTHMLTPDALAMMDTIARTGSFAAAARELAPPLITRRVAADPPVLRLIAPVPAPVLLFTWRLPLAMVVPPV